MEGRQSRAADVYSYGVTLWELITGGSPYKGLSWIHFWCFCHLFLIDFISQVFPLLL